MDFNGLIVTCGRSRRGVGSRHLQQSVEPRHHARGFRAGPDDHRGIRHDPVIAVGIRKEDSKKQIVILGILGYLFYAYGIYVIERVYNVLYYLYLAVFGLSFWSMAYGAAKIRADVLRKVHVPRLMRNISAGFSLVVALVFNVLWIIQLLPLVRTGEKIEFLYSIYILDLCFIMPAFVILGIMALRKAGLGLLLIPAMFILGFILIFSLAVSELMKPLYDLTMTFGGIIPSLVLSVLFLILAALHLQKLKLDRII